MNFNFYHMLLGIAVYCFGSFIGYKLGFSDGQDNAIKKFKDEIKKQLANS